MKRFVLVSLAAVVVLAGGGCTSVPEEAEVIIINDQEVVVEETVSEAWAFQGALEGEKIENKQIRLSTEKGDIVFELFADTAPLTVSNFVYLTEGGYYNGLTFHRREEGFVIQGGDPNGTGSGGPGYRFEDELKDNYQYERGIVAMANAGPNTNGSQFFIMLGDVPLPKAYTIFGRVTEGLEVVDAIAIGDTMTTVAVEDKQ
ncbi:MAG: peptidylprolyl isomerase [Parcubacteria group bacterium]|nr:peptidylprolyl isomerase [Parcubacteria group bacterium]